MGDPDWLLSSLSSWWDTPSQQREHEGSLGTEQSAPRIWFFFPWTRITVKLELAVDSWCWVLCAKISQQNNTCEFCRANTRSQLQFPDLQRVELEGKKKTPLYMNSVLDVESQRCSSQTRAGDHQEWSPLSQTHSNHGCGTCHPPLFHGISTLVHLPSQFCYSLQHVLTFYLSVTRAT